MKSENEMPRVILLGSTGSVGEQAIDVARQTNMHVAALAAHQNWKRVEEQTRLLGVGAVAMTDEAAAKQLKTALADTDIRVFGGQAGLLDMIRSTDADFALNAILGEAGLLPTLAALESGKHLALANKESLVVAGDIVMQTAKANKRRITPVDSEHCAVYQALRAGRHGEIKKLILTASGGPFFGKQRADLAHISVKETLAHPTWQMGAKITVDSATLMNKGFEVIEAAHLFGVPADRIDVLVHRESMIHSMVEYIDNSVIAQMSVPDMRLCVQYALSAPRRNKAVIPPLDLAAVGKLTFAKPDEETFVLLPLARRALQRGGAATAVVNAANEVAVAAFLSEKISLLRIFDIVTRVSDDMPHAEKAVTLPQILDMDKEARERAAALL